MSKHPPTSTHLLEAVNLHKTYCMGRVDVPVLKGASLEVQRGEWVAILGASGSGKSTLLHLLGDLDHPDRDEGTVKFAGKDITAMSQGARNVYRNRSIGFVFQFYHLLPELNVLENTMISALVKHSLKPRLYWIGISVFAAMLGVLAMLALVWRTGEWSPMWKPAVIAGVGALAGLLVLLPLWMEARSMAARISPSRGALRNRAEQLLCSFGLGHRLRHRPRELSGGERQRVAIARALMNEPEVLLADEPTGNLDEETGSEILDLIAEQHRSGLTIVMVTHDINVAQRADRIVKLHAGRVEK